MISNLMFMQTSGKYGQGSSFYTAPNPPYSAQFTYYLKKALKSRRQERRDNKNKLFEAKGRIPQPEKEVLRDEEQEDEPYHFKGSFSGIAERSKVNW